MKRLIVRILLFIAPVQVFAEFLDVGTFEIQKLTLRSLIRIKIIENLDTVSASELKRISGLSLDEQLESLTLLLLKQDLNPESDLLFWEKLRRADYWKTVAKVLSKKGRFWIPNLKDEYIYRAKLRGIGFSTYYVCLKISGFFLGAFALASKNLPMLILLNSFSWNTSIATLLSAPAALWKTFVRTKRVGGLGRLRSYRQSLSESKKKLGFPYVFFEDDPNSIAIFMKETSFFGNPARGIINYTKNLISNGMIDSNSILRILESKDIDDAMKAVWLANFLARNYREHYLSFMKEYSLDSIYKPKSQTFLENVEGLQSWISRLVGIQNYQEIGDLWDTTPISLSTLQRIDIWMNIVMPFLAKRKANVLNTKQFRNLYKNLENIYVRLVSFRFEESIETMEWPSLKSDFLNQESSWSRFKKDFNLLCSSALLIK